MASLIKHFPNSLVTLFSFIKLAYYGLVQLLEKSVIIVKYVNLTIDRASNISR